MPVHEMLIYQHGVNVYGFTITVHNDLIAKSGNLITRFVRATRKAVEELPAERELGVQALVKAIPELDPVRERKVLERTLQFLSGKDRSLSWIWLAGRATMGADDRHREKPGSCREGSGRKGRIHQRIYRVGNKRRIPPLQVRCLFQPGAISVMHWGKSRAS